MMHRSMSAPLSQVAVLLTCHNRREKTLAALTSLFRQQGVITDPAAYPRGDTMHPHTATAELSLTVFLVDDGCTDGTAAAVAAQFPQVHVIPGSGQLFWNRGMRLAWLSAMTYAQQQLPQRRFDAYLWLNDDVQLQPQALALLLESYRKATAELGVKVGAMVGSCLDPQTKQVTYGGRCRRSVLKPFTPGPLLPVSSALQPCDFINGNFCLIPAAAVMAIGILDDAFTHSIGDYDYGLRLQKAGFSLWQASEFSGYCAANTHAGQIFNAQVPMVTRLGWLHRPTMWPPASEWALFVRRHGGPLWPCWWLRVWLRGRFPRAWLWLAQWTRPKTDKGAH